MSFHLLQSPPRFSLNSALRIQIEVTTSFLMEFFPFSLSSSRSFSFISDCFAFFYLYHVRTAHAYIFVSVVRMYVAMRDGTGRRTPVGAIVAAQITMPDRRRGQTF